MELFPQVELSSIKYSLKKNVTFTSIKAANLMLKSSTSTTGILENRASYIAVLCIDEPSF